MERPHDLHRDRARRAARVAFIGDLGEPRAAEFGRFLRERYRDVTLVERARCDRDVLRDLDVVLLDWPKAAGIAAWRRQPGATPAAPLGERDAWRTPTLLLGEAGLNLAHAWSVKGGFG